MLEFVEELAIKNKKAKLRLDCAENNEFLNNYYKNEATASGEGRTCHFNGKISNYVIMKNNVDNTLSFEIEDEIIRNEFNLDNINTGEPKEILDKIIAYIKENGGVCLEEK